ncbi:protein FAR1-RELATED SEQUENCE 3-like [Abeliophyllum distichum]|uniref:Protein FAR1-RELATED SEQUENCE 3-like n=1 Tax=Abeliophyllum distichum TaxID=126358 RepID=A0ABD1V3J8_9LAMI
MLRLKEAYGDRDGLVIVSDRHNGIENATVKVYPRAMHGVCSYHLFQNLKKRVGKKSKFIRQPFNAAARAYTVSEFDIQMRHLDTVDEDIRGIGRVSQVVKSSYDIKQVFNNDVEHCGVGKFGNEVSKELSNRSFV